MDWDATFRLTTAVLTSLGGGAIIVFGLSAWLGKVWADRIARNEARLLDRDFEKAKRYSEFQFQLYNELWSGLCDLRITGDELWNNATMENAKRFARCLKTTSDTVTRKSLLIDEQDYQSLRKLLTKFNEFDVGKTRLIELRRQNVPEHGADENQIRSVIAGNRKTYDDYINLLSEIEPKLRQRIKGL